MSELALLSKPVLMRRLALAAIAAVAGLFYAWALGQDTLEYYYGAAVRSMSMSWHDFIFGAFDPAGPIGGLTGTIPSPTLGQLQPDIRAGRFHLVWIATDTDPRLKWLATHCSQLSPRFYTCVPADAG